MKFCRLSSFFFYTYYKIKLSYFLKKYCLYVFYRRIILYIHTHAHTCTQDIKYSPTSCPEEKQYMDPNLYFMVLISCLHYQEVDYTVSVCQNCHNKLPQTGGLETQKFILSDFWRTEAQMKVLAGLHYLGKLGRKLFPASSSLWLRKFSLCFHLHIPFSFSVSGFSCSYNDICPWTQVPLI